MSPTILRNIKPISITVGILAVLAVAGSFATNYGWVSVEVTSTSSDPVAVTITSASTSAKMAQAQITPNKPTSFLVHTGTLQVEVGQGKRVSLGSGAVKPLQTNRLSLTLHDEGTLSKVAIGSKGCGLTAQGVYYSYGCNGSSQIYTHTAATAGAPDSSRPYSGRLYDKLEPFKDGILTLLTDETAKSFASYVEPASQRETSIALPSNLQDQDAVDLELVPNDQSDSTYAFAIVGRTNHLWALYRNAADTHPLVALIKSPSSSLLNTNNQLMGDTIATYFSARTAEVVPDGNATPAQAPPGYLMVTKAITGSTIASIPVTDTTAYSLKLLDTKTVIAGLTNGNVRVFNLNNKKLSSRQFFVGATNLITHGSMALFKTKSGLYKYDPSSQTAFRVFSSVQLPLDSFDVIGDMITLSSSPGSQSSYNVYLINPNKSATYPQPE
jgi:hypothetical protein